jgi:beta-alanine--pyruvate transaminase
MRHTHLKENYFTKGEGAHGVELAEDLVRFVNLYGAENIARVSSSRSPGPAAASCRPRDTSNGCAKSAMRTASCWCSMK